jgi:hypothetical protein
MTATLVGPKATTPGAEALVDLTRGQGSRGERLPVMPRGNRPVALPSLPEGHRLFAGYDQGLGEQLVLIETLEDAQELWDRQDYMLESPIWYSAPVLFAQDN